MQAIDNYGVNSVEWMLILLSICFGCSQLMNEIPHELDVLKHQRILDTGKDGGND